MSAKRKMTAFLVGVWIMVLSVAVPVQAEKQYVFDYAGVLTDSEVEQLDQLATVFTQMGASQAAGQLSAVKSQLDTVAQFRDGVKAYTAGVGEAAGGSQELFQGLSVLYTASEPLVDGTDAVVDALMDMVEAQLEESVIQVELTADNYKEELDQLIGH